jgi:monovalent cation:proton antiporter-2 (CPA2) family protein
MLHAAVTCSRPRSVIVRSKVAAPADGEEESSSGGATEGAATPTEAAVISFIEKLSDTDMAETPELIPLRDAVVRARQTTEELAAKREALEAEAQSVAELAVMEESKLRELESQFEEVEAEMVRLLEEEEALKRVIEAVQERVKSSSPQGEGEEEEVDLSDLGSLAADLDAVATLSVELGLEVEDEEDGPTTAPVSSMMDFLRAKSDQLQSVKSMQAEVLQKMETLKVKVGVAEEKYAKADEIAGAAMKAAEDAVKDEMDAITVSNETESAMVKVFQDLKYFDDSTQRRGEEFADKQKTMVAAVEDAATENEDKAAPDAAEGTTNEAIKEGKAFKESDVSQERLLFVGLLRRYWQRHTVLVAVGAVMLGCACIMMTQENVAMAVQSYLSVAGAKLAAAWECVSSVLAKVPLPHVHESEAGILETIWLLMASVIFVPLVCKLPGGSPVLGFLAGGAMIGPYALGIIQDVESIRHLAELGVVLLLFNIGLELSLDKLKSMAKMVFGMGTAQVAITLGAIAWAASLILGPSLGGPAAVILGGGFALSTTAIGMQVLSDRGESGATYGRATFSVLLLQDLAVVVLLMLIPLLAPGPGGAPGAEGLMRIGKAIGLAAVKAVACMGAIFVVGRSILRPLYRRVADTSNNDIFAALTLLIVLGTSLVTQLAGLSLALGAFLAGLLLAETEYHIQVESDIAPFKGILMGLFFMTVGMEISMGLFAAKFKSVLAALALLIAGKVAIMTAVGQAFGLSMVQAFRSGLLLSPGGEFAFVLYGEAVAKGLFGAALAQEMFLVVALSMALTPFLAEFGGKVGKLLEKKDVRSLAPRESDTTTTSIKDHVIIAGFGRVGQLIAQMLSEELIPFVALDTDAGRVQGGKANDLPVYFGDAGSPAVLHSIGADRARAVVVAMDTSGANYRTVYALHKHFPHVKIFCRAEDIAAGIMLEKAGATAVVPETLEPSLQLGAAVLSVLNRPDSEVQDIIKNFRKNHVKELSMLSSLSGSSLGYGVKKDDPVPEEALN